MPSSIERIQKRVKDVLDELEKREGISSKIGIDREANVIRIYGEDSDYVKRAYSGLSEVLELAYTTAEHHPYWAILYHANEISKVILEKWNTDLTKDQIREMSWRCDEIKMSLERLNDRQ
ncbi:MAG: hypothetical protein MN733_38615 [Nitrososphaera sp.]|nr:hypothetical protein [Nitrososphaera sp.]